MSVAPNQAIPKGSDQQAERPPDPFGDILRASSSATSRAAFYRVVLQSIGRHFASPYAALYARLPTEVIQDEYHSGPTDPKFWKSTVQTYLTESLCEKRSRAKLLASRDAALRVGLICVPLHDHQGASIGAIALVAKLTHTDARQHVALLESLAALASYVATFAGAPRPSDDSGPAPPSQALARAATVESVEELAFALTNGLRNKLGCEHVALSLVARRSVRLISISGHDDIRPRSPGVVEIRCAMEECLDAGVPILYGPDTESDASARKYRLHKQWHESSHGASVASLPLHAGEQIVAILSLRRAAAEPFTPENIEPVRKVVEPFAGALLLVRDAKRGLIRHVRDAVNHGVGSLFKRGHIGRKVLVAAAALFAGWFLFGTLDYDVAAPCVVAPAELRHVAMPFDGIVAESKVVAGDRVSVGDVLCVLDHRDLTLERNELLSELALLEQQANAAMASDQPVEARLVEARRRLAQAKLDIVTRRIEQATIHSPLSGLVVSGDLRTHVGSVMKQGDELFQVAPLDHWTLEIEAPEYIADELVDGLTGRFAGHARPEDAQEFTVRRVHASSELRDNRNVYIAEADVDVNAEWMRPGMEGVSRVRIGRRPVWWVSLHRFIDYLRLNYWL